MHVWTTTSANERDSRAFEVAIDEAMPELLERFSVAGAAVAQIAGGEVVWMRGYGLADVDSKRPITPHTHFNVGSISKTVTAWGAMRLVEAGKVDLDAPAGRYLRRWRIPDSAFDAEGVTIRRLLSHTSGISAHDYRGSDPSQPLPAVEESLSGRTGTGVVQLVARPNTSFSYSGANFLILQLLIEEVSGKHFQAYMADEVFNPLGMSRSQFGLPAEREVMAMPHDAFGKPLPLLRYNDLSAAGLTATLADLARFAQASLVDRNEGRSRSGGVLSAKSLALMQSAQPLTRWADEDPYGPSPQYGLGYTVRPAQFAGAVGVGHGGSNNGWESLIQVVPSTGDGIVILTNSSNGSAVIASVLCHWRRWGAKPGQTVACPRIDVKIPVLSAYRSKGIAAASALYKALQRDEPVGYDFSVSQLNSTGYQLLRAGDPNGAIEIFKLNTAMFPNDWNVFDSLGEAYLRGGDRARAIESYRKSIELNPQNDNGRQALKSLGVETP